MIGPINNFSRRLTLKLPICEFFLFWIQALETTVLDNTSNMLTYMWIFFSLDSSTRNNCTWYYVLFGNMQWSGAPTLKIIYICFKYDWPYFSRHITLEHTNLYVNFLYIRFKHYKQLHLILRLICIKIIVCWRPDNYSVGLLPEAKM